MHALSSMHLLFTGCNNKPTYGITVQSSHSKEYCKHHGLQYTCNINTYSLNTQTTKALIELRVSQEDITFIRLAELPINKITV